VVCAHEAIDRWRRDVQCADVQTLRHADLHIAHPLRKGEARQRFEVAQLTPEGPMCHVQLCVQEGFAQLHMAHRGAKGHNRLRFSVPKSTLDGSMG
jgi:hypothetical protein